ncbi:MAG: FAD-dependent oxidoreductase [Desulfosarcina sp.]|nr:FAD-dependent oxidoreductase [Desulfobacterales bacterium]
MRSKRHVIIVGLGLAGLSAARALSGRGLDILLMDENSSPGGQYLRRVPRRLGVDYRRTKEHLRHLGYRLLNDFCQGGVTISRGTQILGLEDDGRIWGLGKDGRIEEHHGEYIILATGARERFLPFSGWTLPGVVSPGAAQILIKSAGVLPGRTHLIGGAGPLPLAVAGEVSAAGGQVQAFWNQTSWSDQLRVLGGGRHHLSKIVLGMKYFARLSASRTSIRNRCKVLEARGNGVLEQVVLAKMDDEGHAVNGSEKTYEVDCLAAGYGFVPNLELAMLAGCELEYDPAKGGWVVKVDDSLQSSVPPIIAAGELTGIAGAEKSLIEGQLAGLAVVHKIDSLHQDSYQKEMARLQQRRRREMAFGGLLNSICRAPRGMLEEVPDPTIICRCEDITMGQIRQQIRNGFTSLDAIKKATNSGMGNCQGRTCGPILHDILSAHTPMRPEKLLPLSIRSPIKPVPLSALAEWDGKDFSQGL